MPYYVLVVKANEDDDETFVYDLGEHYHYQSAFDMANTWFKETRFEGDWYDPDTWGTPAEDDEQEDYGPDEFKVVELRNEPPPPFGERHPNPEKALRERIAALEAEVETLKSQSHKHDTPRRRGKA